MENISKEETERLVDSGLAIDVKFDEVTENYYYYVNGLNVLDSSIIYYRSIREAYDNYFSNYWPKKEDMDLYRDVTKNFNDSRKRVNSN